MSFEGQNPTATPIIHFQRVKPAYVFETVTSNLELYSTLEWYVPNYVLILISVQWLFVKKLRPTT